MIDGTYYGKDICLIVYRDNTIKFTQLYRFTDGEWYKEMKEDLMNLLSLSVQIESITCDGHPSLLKAIRKACHDVVAQRCVIHVQRMCRIEPLELLAVLSKYLLAKPYHLWFLLGLRFGIYIFMPTEKHKDTCNQKLLPPMSILIRCPKTGNKP